MKYSLLYRYKTFFVFILLITHMVCANFSGLVELTDGHGVKKYSYPGNDTIWVEVIDADLNTNSGTVETGTVAISSSTETTAEMVTVTEIAVDTALFRGFILGETSATPAADGKLQAQTSDEINVVYTDAANDYGNVEAFTTVGLYGSTELGGTLAGNKTLTKAASPYVITSTLTVPSNVTLTIEPGVEVRVAKVDPAKDGNGDLAIVVQGTLTAIGSATDSIKIVSNAQVPTNSDWVGIQFNSRASVVCDYVTLKHAVTGIYGYSTSYGAELQVKHSLLDSINHRAIYVDRMYDYDAFVVDSNVISNAKQGVYLYYRVYNSTVPASISGNTISTDSTAIYRYGDGNSYRMNLSINNNTITGSNSYGSGIYVTGYQGRDSLVIENNVISNYRSSAIYSYQDTISANSVITGNTISDCGIGIHGRGTVTISDNNITDCYNDSYSKGIYIEGGYATMDGNVIDNSPYGIYFSGNGVVTKNTIKRSRYAFIGGGSNIVVNYNNIMSSNTYAFQNTKKYDIDARYNYWDSTLTSFMNEGNNPKNISKIYDRYDLDTLGKVNYAGWLPAEYVETPLVLTSNIKDTTLTEGDALAFTVTATGGSQSYTYQWQKNGADIANTSKTLAFASIALADSGSYSCIVSDGLETKTSVVGTVKVNEAIPFSISSNVKDTTIVEGSALAFTVTANGGTGNYSYQWKKGSADIVGATTNILAFNAIAKSDEGTYSCVVSDGSSTKTTTSGTVAVTYATPFTITSKVKDTTVVEGTSLIFTVSATGGSQNYTYQWMKGGVAISNATGKSLILSPIAKTNEGVYSCAVSDGESAKTTATGTVTVSYANPFSISSNVSDTTIKEGTALAYTVTATGGSKNYTYQWMKNGGALVGKTTNILSFNAVAHSDSGSYHCVVSDGESVKNTTVGKMTVTVAVPLSVTSNIKDTTIIEGTALAFTVTATGGTGNYSYQWQKDGVAMNGGTTQTLSFTAITKADEGVYRCIVSDGETLTTSSAGDVTVTYATPFTVTSNIKDTTLIEGTAFAYTVTATGGTKNYTYQWQKDGVLIGNSTSILSFTALQKADAGVYNCVVSDGESIKTTVSGTLTVDYADPFAITSNIGDTTLIEGSALAFTVTASGGSQSYTYRWFKGADTLVAETGAILTFNALTLSDSGAYYCEVSDGETKMNTAVGRVTVTEKVVNIPPVITSSDAENGVVGTPLSYVATATDANNDPVAIAFSGIPTWMTQAGDTVSGTPVASGAFHFMVIATDGIDTTKKVVTLTIAEPVNNAPTLEVPFNDTTIYPLESYYEKALVSHFADVDGDPLTISANLAGTTELPVWLELVNGELFGNPEVEDTGSYEIVVTATDPKGLSVSDSYIITVDKGVDIDFVEENEMELTRPVAYPNPAPLCTEKVEIFIPENFVGDGSITIFDVNGNELDYQEISISTSSTFAWDLRNAGGQKVGSGTYVAILTVTNDAGVSKSAKIMIGVKK